MNNTLEIKEYLIVCKKEGDVASELVAKHFNRINPEVIVIKDNYIGILTYAESKGIDLIRFSAYSFCRIKGIEIKEKPLTKEDVIRIVKDTIQQEKSRESFFPFG